MKKVKHGGKRKGAGRKPTGKDPIVALRLSPDMIAAIDKAAKAEGVSRSEKIRSVLEKSF